MPLRPVPFLVLALAAVGAGPLGPRREAQGADDPVVAAARASRAGDRDAALALSEAAIAARPDAPAAWNVRAYALSAVGRKEEALAAYEKASALDPRDVLSRVNRASVLIALDRAADALAPLDEVLRLAPRHARAQNHRGVVLERLGRLDEARAAYRTAVTLDPKDAVAYNNLGSLAFRRGVDAAAAAHFARAVELDPAFQPASVNAALALSALARLRGGDPAGEDALLAAGARPDADYATKAKARGVLGARAARARNWAEAKTHFLEQATLDPSDAGAWNDLAVAEDQLGEFREALSHLEAALELRGDDATLRNNIGVVHVHRGDYASAEAAFRQVLLAEPTFHRAWHNLGVVLGARGDRGGAATAFRRASDLAPADASTLYNLAILMREAGADRAQEKAAYERALLVDPDLTEAHLSLGTLLADPATPGPLRDPDKARTHLRRFLELAFADDAAGRKQATDWLVWLDAAGR